MLFQIRGSRGDSYEDPVFPEVTSMSRRVDRQVVKDVSKALSASETSAIISQSTRRNISEDTNPQNNIT